MAGHRPAFFFDPAAQGHIIYAQMGLIGFLAIAGSAIIAVSALSYYLVERRFIAPARPADWPGAASGPYGKLQ
jgi:peptidoglycan/LPS O-acetylase OafA/YrhL